MTTRYEWARDLRCRKCGNTGKANLSRMAGYMVLDKPVTKVESCPSGFEWKSGNSLEPIQFYCSKCNIIAAGSGDGSRGYR